ncbi:MAG: exodeoxyribonuclease VII large subunit [Acutalibacteraceae bacterium]|jgi:exodeoxyribonuclease VII large subunit|nr:exodeoxyribonuclease VII large subunit [Acutalibacteraceae bacterium]
MRKNSILTVSQLNFYTKSLLDGDPVTSQVIVQGEISNLNTHYRSGHIYLSLKDEKSVISAVMFSGNASRLKFKLEDGMSVIAMGRVSLYEATGQYQLYINQLQPDGIGDLTLAFNQLKAKLDKMGLFNEEFKKKLPEYPETIGVITSDTGAVRRDIETVLARRYPLATMLLYPASVQGDSAVPELIKGIKYFNKNKVDVIIIGRGGGSMEDLWCFNSEQLAYEIFKSQVPIISAVGHATDVTICDFVADKSAPTPSAAAELAVPDSAKLLYDIISYQNRINTSIQYKITAEQQRIDNLSDKLSAMSESYQISRIKAYLDSITLRLNNSIANIINSKNEALKQNTAKLNVLSPLNILSRGYSLVYKEDTLIDSVNDININDKIKVQLSNGLLECTVDNKGFDKNAKKKENL